MWYDYNERKNFNVNTFVIKNPHGILSFKDKMFFILSLVENTIWI